MIETASGRDRSRLASYVIYSANSSLIDRTSSYTMTRRWMWAKSKVALCGHVTCGRKVRSKSNRAEYRVASFVNKFWVPVKRIRESREQSRTLTRYLRRSRRSFPRVMSLAELKCSISMQLHVDVIPAPLRRPRMSRVSGVVLLSLGKRPFFISLSRVGRTSFFSA